MRVFRRVIIGALLCVAFLFRYWTSLPDTSPPSLRSFYGKMLTLQGLVTSFPDDYGSFQQAEMRIIFLKTFGQSFDAGGVMQIRVRIREKLAYGDVLEVSGMIEEPYRKDPRVAAAMFPKNAVLVARGEGNFLVSQLARLREYCLARLRALLPDPIAGFAAGILMGVRSSIPVDVIMDFRKAGLTHILALSGYNIVIIINVVGALFSFVAKRKAIFLTLATLTVFVIFVGASASVLRAAVMGSLGLIASFFGRRAKGIRSLFIAGYIMAMASPFIVFYDIGFQLSFAATAGILLFAAPLREYLRKVPEGFSLRDSLATTLSAQTFTLPIILFYFKGISLIALFANLIILPAIPLLMLGSFLSLFFGKIVAAPTWILFRIVLWIIHALASLPFAFAELPANDVGDS